MYNLAKCGNDSPGQIIQQHPGTLGQGYEEFKASLSFIMRPTQKVGKDWLDGLEDGGPHYHAQQPKFDGYHPHSVCYK